MCRSRPISFPSKDRPTRARRCSGVARRDMWKTKKLKLKAVPRSERHNHGERSRSQGTRRISGFSTKENKGFVIALAAEYKMMMYGRPGSEIIGSCSWTAGSRTCQFQLPIPFLLARATNGSFHVHFIHVHRVNYHSRRMFIYIVIEITRIGCFAISWRACCWSARWSLRPQSTPFDHAGLTRVTTRS